MARKARNAEDVRETVRKGYARRSQSDRAAAAGPRVRAADADRARRTLAARGVGYSEDDLARLPEGANMGLSCGNPTALASLAPGEVVLDLGSGGGFDVFIAGHKVGSEGARHRRRHDAGDARQGARQHRGLSQGSRLRQRRVPPRRDRAPPGRGRLRRRRHLQLRHQPLARQAAGLARDGPRPQARRPRRRFRHRPEEAPAAEGRRNGRSACRLHRRRGARLRNGAHGAGSRARWRSPRAARREHPMRCSVPPTRSTAASPPLCPPAPPRSTT